MERLSLTVEGHEGVRNRGLQPSGAPCDTQCSDVVLSLKI